MCAVSDCVSSPKTRELDAGTPLVPTAVLTPPSWDAKAQCLALALLGRAQESKPSFVTLNHRLPFLFKTPLLTN